MTLQEFFHENNKVALGFSGGVDSSYLLYAGLHFGADIKAYYVKTAFQPQFELEDAVRMAESLGTDITILDKDILSIKRVKENCSDRCYYCKTELFSLLQSHAAADGYSVLIDGTNASDEVGDRPGMRALQELSVRSPLRECGLTKDEIRRNLKEAGLFTWNKPAYACLATRIPTGTEITEELLSKIERGENILIKLGFSDFRIRLFNGAARIQLHKDQFPKAIELSYLITQQLSSDFNVIMLDLMPR